MNSYKIPILTYCIFKVVMALHGIRQQDHTDMQDVYINVQNVNKISLLADKTINRKCVYRLKFVLGQLK